MNRCRIVMEVTVLAVLFLAGIVQAADKPTGKPATVAEAAQVINFMNFATMAGAQAPNHRSIASMSYEATGKVPAIYEFQRKQLAAQKWQELPQSYSSDQAASATFSRDGFKVSVSVFSVGKPDAASVSLQNHGNVDVQKLPIPPGAKLLYGGPVSTAYVTESAVDKTTDNVRQLLAGQGWKPYGSAGDQHFFKQNAVRLSARISTAPAQGGKTVIDYSTEQLSTDLPAPEVTDKLQYTDSPAQLFFDCDLKHDEVFRFYRDTLGKMGWKATTDNPIKIDWKNELIFRNTPMDMLTLEVSVVEGKQRILLKHQTAAQVAELDKKAKESLAKKKMEKEKPSAQLALALPAGATDVEHAKQRLEFKLASGKAKAAVETIRTQLKEAGWQEKMATVEAMFGTLSLEKGPQSVSITYVDPGIIPAEFTVSAMGVELELKK